jgi:hypothetical protein
MENIKKYLAQAVVMLILVIFAAMCLYLYVKADNAKNRNVLNQVIMKRGIEYFQTRDKQNAAKILALEYSKDELRAGVDSTILAELKNVNIKVKNLQSYSQTVITNEKHITTTVRDTIIYDSIPAEYFCYDDKYYSIYGLKIGDQQNVIIDHSITLNQFVHKGDRITKKKGKKMPEWWFFTPRKLTQTIYCDDSTTHISYTRFINVVK